MKEVIESQNLPELQNGEYELQFTETEKFVTRDGKNLRRFSGVVRKVFESEINPVSPNFTFVLPPWKYQELAVVLGGTKGANGAVEWNDETVPGKVIRVEITHNVYKGKLFLELKNIELITFDTGIPF